ncbi:MAG: stage III sporulation protein AD [Bacillota bacterium]
MEIAQVVGFGIMATIFILFIRQDRPEIGQLLSIAVGIILIFYLFGYLRLIVDIITELALEAEVNAVFLRTLLRVIGVAYLAEFGAQICRDAGEGNVALKIEFAGKLIILVMTIPVLIAVLESIVNIIP